MKRYLLKEDVPLQKLNVRLSSELIDKIEDINTSNYVNKEELARWHDFLDGMISWISNPVVAWDNMNQYQHFPNGTTHIVEHGYDVSFVIKTNSQTNSNYIFIFDMKLNWREFGLRMPSTFVEDRSRIDRIITETLNKFIIENTLMENKQVNQKIKKH